jgi:hypothetical protein
MTHSDKIQPLEHSPTPGPDGQPVESNEKIVQANDVVVPAIVQHTSVGRLPP